MGDQPPGERGSQRSAPRKRRRATRYSNPTRFASSAAFAAAGAASAGRMASGSGEGGAFGRAAHAAGLEDATPYTLRHSFCSLLLHEGRSVIDVARQLGHGAQLTLETYGHLIEELADAPRLSAEDAIEQARLGAVSKKCPTDADAADA